MSSTRDDPTFGPAIAEADDLFRRGFAALLKAGIRGAGSPSHQELDSRITPKLTQGNPGAIRDASNGAGWIFVPYAAELFRQLAVPNASKFAIAYEALKAAVDGKTEPYYRRQRQSRR